MTEFVKGKDGNIKKVRVRAFGMSVVSLIRRGVRIGQPQGQFLRSPPGRLKRTKTDGNRIGGASPVAAPRPHD